MTNNLFPKFNAAKTIAAVLFGFILLCLILGLFSSCNKSVPLRHYKKIAADIVPFDNEAKKNIMAQKCNAAFPVNEIIKIKDSITTKYVKVQDRAEINKLKALLAKGCPTIDIDSLLFYNMLTDTIYIDRFQIKTSVVKDTVGNYFRALNEASLLNQLNEAKAINIGLTELQKQTQEKYIEAKRTSDKWRLRFYVLLTFVLLYVALRVISLFRTLPIKL